MRKRRDTSWKRSADIERVMGAENPHTLSAMKDLAAFYCVTGRYGESEKLQLKTLEVSRRVFGARHAETLQSAYWLAVVYRDQGRLREADALLAETLALQREELGSEHPDTLLSIGNTARVLGKEGTLGEAEKLLQPDRGNTTTEVRAHNTPTRRSRCMGWPASLPSMAAGTAALDSCDKRSRAATSTTLGWPRARPPRVARPT